MVRKIQLDDLERVMEIWLDTNIRAHSFVPAQYWKENYDMVKEMMPDAEVYVYENDDIGEVQGFIGLEDSYIAGFFVWHKVQSNGIGKCLLDYAKTKKEYLTLNVYEKNQRAIGFYERENFKLQIETVEESTGEKEYQMIWKSER